MEVLKTLTMASPILDKNLYTAKKSGDSKNSGDGKVTVTAELPSPTKRAVFAANNESGQVYHLHPQKRLSRNVERVWAALA